MTETVSTSLSEADAGADPFALLRKWFDAAVSTGLREPNAMTLATATASGVPSARIVLLKQIEDRGLVFFTNYLSRKGQEIANNPRAALVLFWPTLERQVRVEGILETTTDAESDEYFATRPANSRLGAWASQQSSVLSGREELERRHQEFEARHPNGDIPRPPHWGGYRVLPEVFEFWQGRASRLHDRIRFRMLAGTWVRDRLSP